MSPFCDLSKADSLANWAKDIKEFYKEDAPEYIKALTSPERKMYPTQKMEENEIFTSLAQVLR